MRGVVDSYTAANKDPIYTGSKPKFRWEQDGRDLANLNLRLREAVEEKVSNYILPRASGCDLQNRHAPTKESVEMDKLAWRLVGDIGPSDTEPTWGACAYETLQGLANVNKVVADG